MTQTELLQKTIQEAYEYGKHRPEPGEVASYIPELGKADPNALGVAVALPDGTVYFQGDAEAPFTVQSISKVLTLMFSLEHYGKDAVFSKVGMEPTGDPFNCLMKLETTSDRPFNPMINAGAIVTAGLIEEHGAFDQILDFIAGLCGRESMTVNEAVYHSERTNGSRNRSLAYLLSSKGLLGENVDQCVELYFRLCSIDVTASDLARVGRILALGGTDPVSGRRFVAPWVAQVTKTLMLTCGMYDGSGEFAVHVGVPSKSGVGGGILSCVDRRYGIGVYGPALDPKGNSMGGGRIVEYLSQHLNLHLFPIE